MCIVCLSMLCVSIHKVFLLKCDCVHKNSMLSWTVEIVQRENNNVYDI